MQTSSKQVVANNQQLSRHVNPKHLIIISGEIHRTETLQLELTQANYRVSVVHDGLRGILAAQRFMPDLVIADWSSPRLSGVEICARLRANWNLVPIILLTQEYGVKARIAGLRAGASDCLSWPLVTEELLARIHANLPQPIKRSENLSRLRCADLVLNFKTREVFRGVGSAPEKPARLVQLTAKEFDFLAYMMTHYYQVLTRSQILENVWGYDFSGSSNIIEVYVRYLRRKLEALKEDRLIYTMRGVGYILREPLPCEDLNLTRIKRHSRSC